MGRGAGRQGGREREGRRGGIERGERERSRGNCMLGGSLILFATDEKMMQVHHKTCLS